ATADPPTPGRTCPPGSERWRTAGSVWCRRANRPARVPRRPAQVGAVLAGLSDTWVRDAALLWSGTGQLLGEPLREEVVDAVFSGGLRPQAARVHAAEHTLTVLGAHATDEWKAPVLTCRAWLAWWTG